MSAPVIPAGLSVSYNGDYYANEVIITAGDATHTGFRLYRDDGGGWAQIDQFDTTSLSYNAYKGGESDTGKPWGVTAFNLDGESPRLEINVGAPPATIENLSAARTANAGEVALTWAWAGDSTPVYLFAASEYDAGSGSWMEKGNADAQALGALIADIPRFETWVIRLYATNSTWQQTPLAEFTLPPAAHETSAPENITASVSELERVIIDFDPVSWEAEPDFVYRFAFFQNGSDTPIVLDRGWGVLTNGARRQLYDEVIGLTRANAAEWTCTIHGVSSMGLGDITAPFALVPEATANLLSFDMDETAQITWVFDDWQNAVPLEVETRIDAGPWVPTFITDKTRSNDELYGDQCIIGDDWSGGLLGLIHFHWPFDNQPHLVEARARIQGSADAWLYGPAHSINLRSQYVPELIWGETAFAGQNGAVMIPSPTLFGRRPDYYDAYSLSFALDSDSFNTWRTVEFRTDHRIGLTFLDLAAELEDEQKDGILHSIILRLRVFKDGAYIHDYDFPAFNAVIPSRADLTPAELAWSAKIESVEDHQVWIDLPVNVPADLTLTGTWQVDGIPAISVNHSNTRHAVTVPPPDGLQHEISGLITLVSSRTNEFITHSFTGLVYRSKAPKPPKPASISALLLRQANGPLVDQVQIDFVSSTLVQVIMLVNNSVRGLYYADSTDDTLIIEDCRRYLPMNNAIHSVRFGVRGYSMGEFSDPVLSNAIQIQALPKPPDQEIDPSLRLTFSGLAQHIASAQEISFTQVDSLLRTALTYIREVVSKGGSVDLDYFGAFKATWKNGERLARFEIHKAFAMGTQQGQVLP